MFVWFVLETEKEECFLQKQELHLPQLHTPLLSPSSQNHPPTSPNLLSPSLSGVSNVCHASIPPQRTQSHPPSTPKRYLEEAEPFDRGFYAGPFGWVSGQGAEFVVAIRSAMMPPDNTTATTSIASSSTTPTAAGALSPSSFSSGSSSNGGVTAAPEQLHAQQVSVL